MLRSLKEILGYKLKNLDGTLGHAKDVLIDDSKWTVRYLDIDTGRFVPGRRVLISPVSLKTPDWASGTIPTRLSNQEVKNLPNLSTDEPVSRQWEDRYFSHLGLPHYSAGGHIWGLTTYPETVGEKTLKERAERYDYHLRSINEILGYEIHAKDGEFGKIDDFIVNIETWSIQFVAISTTKWMPGKKVLVSPEQVSSIDWIDKYMEFDLSEKEIKKAPEYDASQPINKEFEARLYDFHGRPQYWEGDRKSI